MSCLQVRLTPNESAVWNTIRCKLAIEAKDMFNADDLHDWGLDKALYGAESHKQGLFFEKLCILGLIVKVNRVLGRYNRYIWNYQVIQ